MIIGKKTEITVALLGVSVTVGATVVVGRGVAVDAVTGVSVFGTTVDVGVVGALLVAVGVGVTKLCGLAHAPPHTW